MKQAIFITVAFFCAQALCQEFHENLDVDSTKNRPSMLSMLSKYVELNGTIDEVMNREGSLTANTESYGGVWLNATQRPSGMCEIEEIYEEEITITDRTPHQVEVEVWCWSIRCTEWETHYREEKRKQNVTKTRTIPSCCENYEMEEDTGKCRPICVIPCESSGDCVAPNTCKCDLGYEGRYCEIDALPEGILVGPNVCERDEMKEEIVRVMEQEVVETTFKEWCWPKIRCTKTKMEQKPVEKIQKMIKPHRVRYCCEGTAQNFMGNRCIPYETENQQEIIQ